MAHDEAAAERIFRTAFGRWLGAPDPAQFFADRDYVRARRAAPHVVSLAAHRERELVGSNFITRWGSVGFFGPLTVQPDLQNQGIAQALLEATVAQMEAWALDCAGLFTFADSPKHLGLYQRYGFLPRFLTTIMARAVPPGAQALPAGWCRYTSLTPAVQASVLDALRELTESVHSGLNLTGEIETLIQLGLGEVLVLTENSRADGLALCHYGARSEAGAETLLVKFAAVRPGADANRNFAGLLEACAAEASACGAATVMAGVNTARRECHATLLAAGFGGVIHGIAMHRHDRPGYSRPGVHVIDDWR